MLVVIRGGGDLATGTALRLYRAKMQVVICETASPTSIRRTVCFSEAVRLGETTVEGVTARRAVLSEVPGLLAEDGVFLCSGIIDTRTHEVEAALKQAGLTLIRKREKNGWAALEATL